MVNSALSRLHLGYFAILQFANLMLVHASHRMIERPNENTSQDTGPVATTEKLTTLEVRVYIIEGRLVPMQTLDLGVTTATRIMRQAGVRLRWLDKDPQRFARSAGTPCAFPYAPGGVRITFFRDRLQTFFNARPSGAGSVLGHLMAHEITHVLQGISRHSETGLMRAHWSPEDYRQMPSKLLPLTPYDIKLIRMGVADWGALTKADACRSVP